MIIAEVFVSSLKFNKVQLIVFLIFSVSIILILRFNDTAIQQSKKVEECSIIYEGNNPKFNIVFLPFKYTDNKRFFEDIASYVYGEFGFQGIEPFKSNLKNFNFYAVMSDLVECDIIDNTLICNELNIKKLAASCPNDFIFVLSDRDTIKDFVSPLRSSAYLNIASINTADHRLVVLHEFAHIYGGLADEYVEESIVAKKIIDF